MMRYKGYLGCSKINEKEGLIFGEVVGLRDVITYQGRTVKEARRAFRESIDLYLRTCSEEGIDPDRRFSGKLLIRTTPIVHRALAAHAKSHGVSINAFAEKVLTRAIVKESSVPPRRQTAAGAPSEKQKKASAARKRGPRRVGV
jgi:predicted HicB family RNase H-like nuclease